MGHRIFDGMIINGNEVDTSNTAETGTVVIGDEEVDVRDMINDDDIRQVFEEDFIRSKEELLKDIDSLLKWVERVRRGTHTRSQAYYNRYLDLVERFREKVRRKKFPEKIDGWWYYEYEVLETGVILYLNHMSMPYLDNEGNITNVSVDTSFELFKVSSKMLTVEQYAKANDVTPTTVRQWIRRGKLRTAVKQGGEWRIPELAEVRDRGYKCAQYEWEDYLTTFPAEYSYINDYRMVTIEQDKDHKDIFNLVFGRSRSGKNIPKTVRMEQKEKEKFELLLITNPFVTPVDAIITIRG